MQGVFSQTRNITLTIFLPLTAGCLWGLAEFFFGTVVKPLLPAGIAGSVMAGISFLFLAAGVNARFRFVHAAGIFFTAAIVKLIFAACYNIPVTHPCIVGPVLAIGIQSAAYILFVNRIHDSFSQVRLSLTGAAIAAAAAACFPLVQYAAGQAVCYRPGTMIPMSLAYVHITALAGAAALPAGIYLRKKYNPE